MVAGDITEWETEMTEKEELESILESEEIEAEEDARMFDELEKKHVEQFGYGKFYRYFDLLRR
jgi:hypothetical protein